METYSQEWLDDFQYDAEAEARAERDAEADRTYCELCDGADIENNMEFNDGILVCRECLKKIKEEEDNER